MKPGRSRPPCVAAGSRTKSLPAKKTRSKESDMKTGMNLKEIATELKAQLAEKKDYVAPTEKLRVVSNGILKLKIEKIGAFEITERAHQQMGDRAGIPTKYYERMKATAPGLLAENLNYWFDNEPKKQMLRTMRGKVRAVLSSRYRPLDNWDLAETVLPLVGPMGCQVESSELTEGHMYLKLVTPKMEAKVVGDVVRMGIVISNSEVGSGSVKVEPMIYTLRCSNGMIAPDYSMKKYHIGRSGIEGEIAEELFKDETRQQDDKAFWMKVRDTVQGSLKRDVFERLVKRLAESKGDKVEGDPVKVVEAVQEHFGLGDQERSGVLKYLIQGGDLTRYGLLNAVTRASQDVKEYERATYMERVGGEVLELPKKDWKAIAEAE